MAIISLILNPGSTSTKIGVMEDETLLFEETLDDVVVVFTWTSATFGNAVSVTIAEALVLVKAPKSKLNTPNPAPTVKPIAKTNIAASVRRLYYNW